MKQIRKGKVKLESKSLYGRNYLTLEENFVSILNKYVCYVRDTYIIQVDNLTIILEETLKNMYNRYLFMPFDYYDSVEIYMKAFKKMFLGNLFYNTHYYAKKDKIKKYRGIQKANSFLQGKILRDDKDLEKIEKFYINVINNHRDNLYNHFIPHADINKESLDFYLYQLNELYEDYFKKNISIFDD